MMLIEFGCVGQIENVPSPRLPILLDMMRTHVSEGIQITVKEVRPFIFDVGLCGVDAQWRYIKMYTHDKHSSEQQVLHPVKVGKESMIIEC